MKSKTKNTTTERRTTNIAHDMHVPKQRTNLLAWELMIKNTYNKCWRLTWPLTDILTYISIGIIYSWWTVYLPSLNRLGQRDFEISVAQGVGDQHDFWPTDLNINRDHLLIKDDLPTKFEASGTKHSCVIRCTRDTDIPTDIPTDRHVQSNMSILLRGGGDNDMYKGQAQDLYSSRCSLGHTDEVKGVSLFSTPTKMKFASHLTLLSL